MNKDGLYDAIGEVDDNFLMDTEQVIQHHTACKRSGWKFNRKMIVIAAIIALLGTSIAVAASMGYNILGWGRAGFYNNIGENKSPSAAVIQEQLEHGQWAYLNDNHIAVIVPEAPVKVLLSDDAGVTWRESTIETSNSWNFHDDWHSDTQYDMQYWGGYVGFNGKENGYLVLTSGASMNHQGLRIYLTNDGGTTWNEIGNPYDVHISVLTGAGFSTDQIGFISYRCFEDHGPDIWWTKDGGDTWEKLMVEIPEKYAPDQHNFTPQSPTFNGKEGIFPIVVEATANEAETTIYMYSHDRGLTWQFE